MPLAEDVTTSLNRASLSLTFHFASRYERDPVPLREEAQAVFRGELPADEPD